MFRRKISLLHKPALAMTFAWRYKIRLNLQTILKVQFFTSSSVACGIASAHFWWLKLLLSAHKCDPTRLHFTSSKHFRKNLLILSNLKKLVYHRTFGSAVWWADSAWSTQCSTAYNAFKEAQFWLQIGLYAFVDVEVSYYFWYRKALVFRLLCLIFNLSWPP